jgi:hypothetical protein
LLAAFLIVAFLLLFGEDIADEGDEEEEGDSEDE